MAAGLTAKRIHQDLRERGFSGGYSSVKLFVQRLRGSIELPFRRMECEPGAELQFDFGTGAWIVADGKRRRPHLFRAVLSHSRKGYSEVVWRQDTETVLRCLENAFRAFGGVVATLVPDNLKAAVLEADWFDPELNPKLRDFCQHYGTALLPTRPATPRHKGKIEAGIKFAQSNALRGRQFDSLAAQNAFLTEWERTIADTRIHGTIRQQVGAYFLQAERAALRPLPASLFPCFEEAKRIVHRDGHVAFRQSYYSTPPEYVGREVWLRAETRVVRIFNLRFEPIAVHARAEPGRFATAEAHLHSAKRTIVERGADYLLERCRLLGAHCVPKWEHNGRLNQDTCDCRSDESSGISGCANPVLSGRFFPARIHFRGQSSLVAELASRWYTPCKPCELYDIRITRWRNRKEPP